MGTIRPVQFPLLFWQGAKRESIPQVNPQSGATRPLAVGLESLVQLGLLPRLAVLVPRCQFVEELRESQGQGPRAPVRFGTVMKTKKRRENIFSPETRADVVRPTQNDNPVVRLSGLVQDAVQTARHGRNDTFTGHPRGVHLRRAVAVIPEESSEGDGVGMELPALLKREAFRETVTET